MATKSVHLKRSSIHCLEISGNIIQSPLLFLSEETLTLVGGLAFVSINLELHPAPFAVTNTANTSESCGVPDPDFLLLCTTSQTGVFVFVLVAGSQPHLAQCLSPWLVA